MEFIPTDIPDVCIIKPKLFGDDRGYFMETYKEPLFRAHGIDAYFVQDNMSSSIRGTLRGLHYQLSPHAQGKLVRVLKGSVYDVAVDLRRGSPTFSKWVGVELTEENKLSLWIPPGFAHGFYVLSDMAEFTYKCTHIYTPSAERGIIWNDQEIGIKWPMDKKPLILSDKDKKNPLLKEAEYNFNYHTSL
ncbi:dTDP-4-dehydrorhamnose 3,5-epimerase [candidate division KSB1 bacterium]|nr:dTDP-4-dehydrorhamnose 3,5-epimerase [candidate division KSB1 bacterium]RQW06016.1 MAG: dTDP-4-dehydrorhamnose 3,5-epimerase [candidate division KSB1 bacterium]